MLITCPVVVVSGVTSKEVASLCRDLGAFHVLDKPGGILSENLYPTLRRAVCKSLFFPSNNTQYHPRYNDAFKQLVTVCPHNVSAWAQECGYDTRALARYCDWCDNAPRDILRTYRLVELVLRCATGPIPFKCMHGEHCDDSDECEHLREFCGTHSSTVSRFLN